MGRPMSKHVSVDNTKIVSTFEDLAASAISTVDSTVPTRRIPHQVVCAAVAAVPGSVGHVHVGEIILVQQLLLLFEAESNLLFCLI